MSTFLNKYTFGTLLLFVALGVIIFFFIPKEVPEPIIETQVEEIIEEPKTFLSQEVVGTSVEGRDIEAYRFGNGETHLLFVGGIHGGYEWNSVVLAYDFIDYFTANQDVVPDNITVSIIPNANPDGVFKVTGLEGVIELEQVVENVEASLGRFNANGVDLNRNFDCKWAPESMWRGNVVGAGTEAFSEPEAQTIRDYVLSRKPKMVVFWHSQSDAVYASECEDGILPETLTIMNLYSNASGYKAIDSFDAYSITGDAEGWLASIGIPAVTVELATHETIEWEKNLAGVSTLLTHYTN